MNLQTKLDSDDIDVASLNLSGEKVIVGYSGTDSDPAILLAVSHNDPIYFTPIEAQLLIASIKSAIERCGEAK